MKITKSHLRKIIKEEMKDLHELKPGTLSGPGPNPGDPPFKQGPRFRDRIAPIQYQNLTKEKGGRLSDIARKALENAEERSRKRGQLEESEVDMQEEIRLIAAEALYAIEDAELIERIRDILPKQMRNVVDGKLKEFKISVDEFIQEKIASLAEEGTVSDHTKPWLQLKPFEEGKKK